MYGRFECVIFGDFNLPYIDWATKTAVAPGKRLVDFTAQHNLVQRVLEPTREDHVLDLVLCTEAGLIRGNVEVCDKLGSSDHRMVSFEIDAGSKNNQGVIMKPNFRRADFRFLRELASTQIPPTRRTLERTSASASSKNGWKCYAIAVSLNAE